MVMAGRIRLSFRSRVLLYLLALCWILVGTCMTFQYRREKEFKKELLDTRLQIYNEYIINCLRMGISPDSVHGLPDDGTGQLRVTVIDSAGNVVYDNNTSTPYPSTNHNDRPEIITARAKGVGYSTARHSESDDTDYFYSARLGDNGMVVRSAALYTHSLKEFLRADRTLLWIMAVMTLLMSLAGFMVARRISQSITRLNLFAARAERGERIYNDEAFPSDELGSIASNIVRLYVQRDQQHREALRQEQDKIRLKKQLTNNINHELKTPVASMLVSLELLRDHPELPAEKKAEFIERLYANAKRLNSMLKDVSVITRMDEGTGMIEKEPIDLRELVDEVAEEERLRTDMRIVTDVPQIVIDGNRQLLESVFRNLIDNAIAYSGGTEISIMADSDGNFTVADNGCGIPEEHLPHIFERFYRVDKGRSRAAGGTGLGLAIVKNAVALHGGCITATNDNGLKMTFRLG